MSWKQVRNAVNNTDLDHLAKLGKYVVTCFSEELGQNALQLAVANNKFKVFDFLVCNYPKLLDMHNLQGDNVFDYIRNGKCCKFIPKLLLKCPDLLFIKSPSSGTTTLQRAVVEGRLVVVKEILKQKPDVIYDIFSDGISLLHLALRPKSLKMLRYLVSIAPKQLIGLRMKYNLTVLYCATMHKDLSLVQFVYKADPSAVDIKEAKSEWTPFLYAVARDLNDIVDFFLRVRPTVIRHAIGNENVLFHCRSSSMLQKLLDFEPSLIDGVNRFEETVLHRAVVLKDAHLVRFIFAKKPSLVVAKDENGQSPLQLAFESQQHSIVAMFLQHAPNVRDFDKDENNTMHMAVTCCTKDVVKQVFKFHIDLINHTNTQGASPFHLALELGKLQVANLFLPHVTMDVLFQTKNNHYEGLQPFVDQQFQSLRQLILPELTNIVLQFFCF